MVPEKSRLMFHPESVITSQSLAKSLAVFLCKPTSLNRIQFGERENRCLYEATWMPTGVVCVTNMITHCYFHLSIQEANYLATTIQLTICNPENSSSTPDEDFLAMVRRKINANLKSAFE